MSPWLVPAVAVVMLGSVWLGGCAPGSIAALRERPHTAYSFEVPADYATVYERLVRRARQRYVFTGIPIRQPGVSTDLSAEDQSASVTLWDSGGIGIHYLLRAELHAIGPAHTKVDVYAARKADAQEARLWTAWADTPLED